MHRIKVIRQIDTGHRVVGHSGKCKNLHGHTYEITVVLFGDLDPESPGFVIDFGVVKQIIDEWDHKMLLWEEDPVVAAQYGSIDPTEQHWRLIQDNSCGILRVPFNPTAENMAEYLCRDFFNWGNVEACYVSVSETNSTKATFIMPEHRSHSHV